MSVWPIAIDMIGVTLLCVFHLFCFFGGFAGSRYFLMVGLIADDFFLAPNIINPLGVLSPLPLYLQTVLLHSVAKKEKINTTHVLRVINSTMIDEYFIAFYSSLS